MFVIIGVIFAIRIFDNIYITAYAYLRVFL